jgi:hypothetical protein
MTQPTIAQVGVQQVVPLLMVKSMDLSLCFYVEGLGFSMTKKWTPEGALAFCQGIRCPLVTLAKWACRCLLRVR